MDTVAVRIIKVIDALNINKSEFARSINVTPAYISKLGKSPDAVPSDRTIADICREFRVSETWLRTGEGEMFLPMDADEELARVLVQVLAEIKLSNDKLIKAIIKSYWRMDDAGKAVIRQLVDDLAQAVQDDGPEQKEKAPGD